MTSGESQERELHEVEGGRLSPLDQFWLDLARQATRDSLHTIEEAARQLIAITTLAQTIYFAAIALGDLKSLLANMGGFGLWLLLLLFLAPLLCWVAGLWAAALVFRPRLYQVNLSSPELSQSTFRRVAAYKQGMLDKAYLALFTGFGFLIASILAYLILQLTV